MMRKLAILGSTGSIGTQALDVAARHGDRFAVTALVAHSSAEKLFEQVRAFRPQIAALTVEPDEIPEDIRGACQWMFGENVLLDVMRACEADDVLVSVVGVVGLAAVMEALSCGKRVLLANKEPLVAGGELVTEAARRAGRPLLPVDSEHSAIFQCLQGAGGNRPRRLILTASGGPFRTWKKEDIFTATKEQALRHPNWHMGRKITIDSASMMNKALEVIEARWLFDMSAEQIDVLIHPQSVIHSMVEFDDGAVMAQLGTPDMRLPILYAMSWPDRLETGAKRLDFEKLSALTFERPDTDRFPGLKLAYDALGAGGTMSAVLNGANEVAVDAFLHDRIRFGQIAELVEETMLAIPVVQRPTLEQVFESDAAARRKAGALLETGRFAP
ncbi:MAG: 1-deoxy-D-xylulose-5-phosphate reductoisomerase [Clostridia bacterium]|nr:1-deoxy-D-xylulose-5-phosphate reductoisomerase [Clostridia bacterium]